MQFFSLFFFSAVLLGAQAHLRGQNITEEDVAVTVATTFFNHPDINGTVVFEEKCNEVIITGNLESTKYKNTTHGMHIHEAGDLSDNCLGTGGHFNPFGQTHGDPDAEERHVGDLGNIHFNSQGFANFTLVDSLVKFTGNEANVLGRAVVIHAGMDDLGLGNDTGSVTTGNAGSRLTCAVIGLPKPLD